MLIMRRPVRRISEPSVLPTHQIEADPWHMFTVLGPSMVDTARYMRQFARHYNGFNVGACLLAAVVEDEKIVETDLFTSANQNLRKWPKDTKICAEPIALAKAKKAGFNKAIAMVVSGPQQPDTQSGLKSATLHSCGEDRDLYWNHDEVRDMVDDDTLHVTVDPDLEIFEIYETNELHTHHSLQGEVPLEVCVDPKFGIWRKAGPLYLREIEHIESQGEEPLRPLVAKLAITGQLADAA